MHNGQQHNCGKCMPCRVNYASQWTVRLLYELTDYYKLGASFLTLTYDNDHLPKDYSIRKKELSGFMKRLRRFMDYEYHEFAPKLRFYGCGEYGEKEKIYFSPGASEPHGRPHYHAIVFGLNSDNDKHRDLVRKAWTKCESWLFDKDRGRESGMQEVTVDDIRYTVGYTQKKLFGPKAQSVYGEALPPFALCSQGLGKKFALENKERLLTNNFTFLNGKKVAVPRYFYKVFDVRASDVIEFREMTQEEINKENEFILSQFYSYLFKICPWYFGADGNIDPKQVMLHNQQFKRRFEVWYSQRQFEVTKNIEETYKQYAKLRGAKL